MKNKRKIATLGVAGLLLGMGGVLVGCDGKTYSVSYNFDNGGDEIDKVEFVNDNSFTPLTPPEKDGYEFQGWTLNNRDLTTDDLNISENIVLKAKWRLKTFSIVYNLNNGVNNENNINSFTCESENILLHNPTRTGFVFCGWFDNEYFLGNAVSNVENGTTSAKQFWAKWDIGVLDLTASANSVTFGDNITLESNHDIAEEVEYKWYKNNQLLNGENGETLTLTNVADSGVYKVEIIVGGLSKTSLTKTIAINKAVPQYSTVSNLEATVGQTLADVLLPSGWAWEDNELSVGNAGSNQFGAIFTPIDAQNYATVELDLTVVINEVEHKINYDLDDGIGVFNQQLVENGDNFVLSTTIPTKQGYVFKGWSDGVNVYQAGETIENVTNDIILVAQWIEGYYININFVNSDIKNLLKLDNHSFPNFDDELDADDFVVSCYGAYNEKLTLPFLKNIESLSSIIIFKDLDNNIFYPGEIIDVEFTLNITASIISPNLKYIMPEDIDGNLVKDNNGNKTYDSESQQILSENLTTIKFNEEECYYYIENFLFMFEENIVANNKVLFDLKIKNGAEFSAAIGYEVDKFKFSIKNIVGDVNFDLCFENINNNQIEYIFETGEGFGNTVLLESYDIQTNQINGFGELTLNGTLQGNNPFPYLKVEDCRGVIHSFDSNTIKLFPGGIKVFVDYHKAYNIDIVVNEGVIFDENGDSIQTASLAASKEMIPNILQNFSFKFFKDNCGYELKLFKIVAEVESEVAFSDAVLDNAEYFVKVVWHELNIDESIVGLTPTAKYSPLINVNQNSFSIIGNITELFVLEGYQINGLTLNNEPYAQGSSVDFVTNPEEVLFKIDWQEVSSGSDIMGEPVADSDKASTLENIRIGLMMALLHNEENDLSAKFYNVSMITTDGEMNFSLTRENFLTDESCEIAINALYSIDALDIMAMFFESGEDMSEIPPTNSAFNVVDNQDGTLTFFAKGKDFEENEIVGFFTVDADCCLLSWGQLIDGANMVIFSVTDVAEFDLIEPELPQ